MSNKWTRSIFRIAGLAFLTAIIVVLQVVTTYFPTKPFAVTLALVPIIIGAAIYGPSAGAYLGGVFSIVVIAMCIFGVDIGGAMVWNANPILCVLLCMLKGVMAGWVAGLLFSALKGTNAILATVVAAIASPIVNTGIFVAGMALFFRPLLAEWAGGSDILTYVIVGMTGVNFLIELLVNVVLSPIIVQIINAIRKQLPSNVQE